MEKTRKIVVGDIHGCRVEFEKLLDKVDFDPLSDELYLVGDLINKGPDSLGVIHSALSAEATIIAGNHELHFLNAVREKTLKKHTSFLEMTKNWSSETIEWVCTWIETLPLYHENEDFLMLHAGLEPDFPLEMQNQKTLCTIRNLKNGDPWHKAYKGTKPIVYGHWALQGRHFTKNTFGLDSGCVYGRELSALIFPEKRLISIPAEKSYVLPQKSAC